MKGRLASPTKNRATHEKECMLVSGFNQFNIELEVNLDRVIIPGWKMFKMKQPKNGIGMFRSSFVHISLVLEYDKVLVKSSL